MKLYENAGEVEVLHFENYDYIELVNEKNGCTAGCRTGILLYQQDSYIQGGIHQDQEGFYVLEGKGSALVGNEEFNLIPGTCFIVPANCYHSIRKDLSCPYIKLFFFHASIK